MAIRKAEAKTVAEPVGSGGVIEELRRRYDRLTQSQKRIAEYIVEHSQAVAFSTVDQMAARLDVNPSTIARFSSPAPAIPLMRATWRAIWRARASARR